MHAHLHARWSSQGLCSRSGIDRATALSISSLAEKKTTPKGIFTPTQLDAVLYRFRCVLDRCLRGPQCQLVPSGVGLATQALGDKTDRIRLHKMTEALKQSTVLDGWWATAAEPRRAPVLGRCDSPSGHDSGDRTQLRTTFSFWVVWTWKANPAMLVEASTTQVQPYGAVAHAKQLDITSESSVVTRVYPY